MFRGQKNYKQNNTLFNMDKMKIPDFQSFTLRCKNE